MRQANGFSAIFGIIAIISLGMYVMACYGPPTWHPDGTKIVFTIFDSENERQGVALHDIKTGDTRVLFVIMGSDDAETIFVQWERSGERVIVLHGNDDNGVNADLIPVASESPAWSIHLPEEVFALTPYPEIDGKLYLANQQIAILDLETGEIRIEELDGSSDSSSLSLVQLDEQIYYVRTTPGETQSLDSDSDSSLDSLEFGMLALDELSLRPLFGLGETDIGEYGIKDVFWIAAEPRGSRLAMVCRTEKKKGEENPEFLLLLDRQGKQSVLRPDFVAKKWSLGNLQWSPDDSVIYASVLAILEDNGVPAYCLAEIPVSGDRPRL